MYSDIPRAEQAGYIVIMFGLAIGCVLGAAVVLTLAIAPDIAGTWFLAAFFWVIFAMPLCCLVGHKSLATILSRCRYENWLEKGNEEIVTGNEYLGKHSKAYLSTVTFPEEQAVSAPKTKI